MGGRNFRCFSFGDKKITETKRLLRQKDTETKRLRRQKDYSDKNIDGLIKTSSYCNIIEILCNHMPTHPAIIPSLYWTQGTEQGPF